MFRAFRRGPQGMCARIAQARAVHVAEQKEWRGWRRPVTLASVPRPDAINGESFLSPFLAASNRFSFSSASHVLPNTCWRSDRTSLPDTTASDLTPSGAIQRERPEEGGKQLDKREGKIQGSFFFPFLAYYSLFVAFVGLGSRTKQEERCVAFLSLVLTII